MATLDRPILIPRAPAVGWRRWVPNAITLARLVLSLLLFVQLSLWEPSRTGKPDWPLVLAALSFTVAAVTDAADGYFARRWNAITRFGRIMDPFADKMLVVGAFVLMAGPAFHHPLPDGTRHQVTGIMPWMVVVILGRELFVTSIRGVLESEGRDFSAMATGKVKMVIQAVAVPVILVLLAIVETPRGSWATAAIGATAWAVVAVTVASVVPYAIRGFAAINGSRTP
ncbi:MAG: CDP-alcohol phosphatidyltransferase family protein [Phycisphaeraceae bacterium]|nr:MAG: CDP-alcohol phosphatidyltransferase family protein [Phycisphaeraceae bacterium]